MKDRWLLLSLALVASTFLSGLAEAENPLPPVWQMICNPDQTSSTAPREIRASLDGLTGDLGGENKSPVWVDGKKGPGYVRLVQSHGDDGHGIWRITIYFGTQMSIIAETEAVFESPSGGERVIDRGRGQLLQFGRELVAEARCRVVTSCTGDLRVCPD